MKINTHWNINIRLIFSEFNRKDGNEMSKDVINLNDKINSNDTIAGAPANKIEPLRIESTQGKVLRTKITGLDSLTGEKLFEEENQIVLGGALFILEKVFNAVAPIEVQYLNDIMGICTNSPIEEKYPKVLKISSRASSIENLWSNNWN